MRLIHRGSLGVNWKAFKPSAWACGCLALVDELFGDGHDTVVVACFLIGLWIDVVVEQYRTVSRAAIKNAYSFFVPWGSATKCKGIWRSSDNA
jgi:hypothetical protein